MDNTSLMDSHNVKEYLLNFDRTFNPLSLPITGTTISSIDLDLTIDCNLDCDYCFKEKEKKHLSIETAKDAITWLILASGDLDKIVVNLIGGEPLLRFNVIKKLVPFAKRRAFQHGKEIHFGMTTNGTIMTTEILDFWEKWGMGFHTSIDGCPIVQDCHRHYKNGKGSSAILSKNLPRILSIRPNTTARATILPDTVKYLTESHSYIFNLGYRDIAFVPGAFPLWDDKTIRVLREQFRYVMKKTMDLYREDIFVRTKFFDEGCMQLSEKKSPGKTAFCGAGRGMVLIDVNGDIWPCHRWCKKEQSDWKLSSIYQQGFNYSKRQYIDSLKYKIEQTRHCNDCSASFLCAGGCPAENLDDTGSIWKKHPNGCKISKIIAEMVVEFHDTLLSEKNRVFMQEYYPKHIKD